MQPLMLSLLSVLLFVTLWTDAKKGDVVAEQFEAVTLAPRNVDSIVLLDIHDFLAMDTDDVMVGVGVWIEAFF